MEVLRGTTMDPSAGYHLAKEDWSRASSGYLSICSKSSPDWSSVEQLKPDITSSTTTISRNDDQGGNNANVDVKYVHTLLFPPEGGRWGWFVCCSCAFVAFVMLGTTIIDGLLLTSLPKDAFLRTNDISLIWVLGARNAVTLILVPVSRSVIRHFGFRVCCLLGTTLSLIGYLLALTATSVYYLVLSSGITVGVGSSLCLTSSFVILSEYFHLHWTRAQAAVLSGAGLGLIVFPLLVDFLLGQVGLQNTVLIICGVIFSSYAVLPVMDPPHKHYATRHFLSTESIIESNIYEISLPLVVPIREKSHSGQQKPSLIRSGGSVFSALKLLPHTFHLAMFLFSAILIGGTVHFHTFPFYSDFFCTGRELFVAGPTFIFGSLLSFYSLSKWKGQLQPFHVHTLSALIISCAILGLLPRPYNLYQVDFCIALLGLGLSGWACSLPMMIECIVGEEQNVGALDLILMLQGVFSIVITFVEGQITKGNIGEEVIFYLTGCSTLSGFIFLLILNAVERCWN